MKISGYSLFFGMKEVEKIGYSDFTKVEIRVGTVLSAEEAETRNPAYVMRIDFGEFGVLKTSAQLTTTYTPSQLVGKQVMAVVNLHEKQVGKMMSQCLVLGAVREDQSVILMHPQAEVKNGTRIL